MTDKELMELAAKAAGIELDWSAAGFFGPYYVNKLGGHSSFRPLTDDGDALRLAVKLGISITPYPIYNTERHSVICKQRRKSDTMREANPTEVIELYGNDPYAATRRAIVRAAAAIGEQMK